MNDHGEIDETRRVPDRDATRTVPREDEARSAPARYEDEPRTTPARLEDERHTAPARYEDEGRPATYEDEARTAPAGMVTSVPAQREAYGGIKIGAAFFGWLAAMGMAFLLTALLAAAGTAVSVATGTDPAEAASRGVQNVQTIGWAGAAVLAVLVLISYYSGGYVAGRMARFSGARQGFGVWLWALAAAIVVAVVATVAGNKYDVMSQLNGFPRIPVKQGDLTTAGIVALVLVAVTSLVGAILGGMAGMGYHRRVDRAGAVEDVGAY